MEGIARYKVRGGKLVTIKLVYSDKIEAVQILGDFFLHPESALGLIEKSLMGMKVDSTLSEIAQVISKVAESNSVEMIGVTPESIAQAILMAVKK